MIFSLETCGLVDWHQPWQDLQYQHHRHRSSGVRLQWRRNAKVPWSARWLVGNWMWRSLTPRNFPTSLDSVGLEVSTFLGITPENRRSQKEILSSHHPFSGAMLVSGRVSLFRFIFLLVQGVEQPPRCFFLKMTHIHYGLSILVSDLERGN